MRNAKLRQFACLAGALVLAVLTLAPVPASAQALDAEQVMDAASVKRLRGFLVGDSRVRDKPRAIDSPQFIPVTDASLYMDQDSVVLIEEPRAEGDKAYIYPRSILVMHEVLNLSDGDGAKRSVTYSPLTGSVAGFWGVVHLHETAFGTTGQHLNMNRVFYDRTTNGVWPQILGQCIGGSLKGQTLSRFPLLWTRWKYAVAKYPDARVLSRQTGYRGYYDRDPYGSYQRDDTWYSTGEPTGPISNRDSRLAAKTRVLGMAVGESAVAFVESAVKQHGVASAGAGLTSLVAFYDQEMDAVRVFYAEADGRSLTFEKVRNEFIDQQTRSRWTVEGVAVEGRLRGLTLERAAAMDCMWFAWAAFFSASQIWSGPDSLLGF